MKRRWYQKFRFQSIGFTAVLIGYVLALSPIPEMVLSSYLREAGFKFEQVHGHFLTGLRLSRLELEGLYGSLVLTDVRLKPMGSVHALFSRSAIFEDIEVEHAKVSFESVTGRRQSSTEVSGLGFFETLGAKRFRIHELEVKLPLKGEPVELTSVEIRNWITNKRSLSVSRLELESPEMQIEFSEQGTRFSGRVMADAWQVVRDEIPFHGRISRSEERARVEFSLFADQWNGMFDNEEAFEVNVKGWTPSVWLNTGIPVQDIQAKVRLSAEELGGNLSLRSFLLALLSDAIEVKAQFRIGNRVYKNEAQRLENQLKPVLLSRKVASALSTASVFRPNSFLFQSEWSGSRDTLRLMPRLFRHKNTYVFEVVSTASRTNEDFLSRAVFERKAAELSEEELKVVQEAAPYFLFRGVREAKSSPDDEEELDI